MKTPITYYGGKQRMLKHILPLIPEHSIYTESFAGGLAVFFAKDKVKTEIINDSDSAIMNFYEVLISDFNQLKSLILKTPYSRMVYKKSMVILELPFLFSPLQRAWAFYVGTNQGFSCAIGSWGCYKKGTKAMGWENKKLLFNKELKERFTGVQIECSDALKVLSSRDSIDTFHYVDPPYFQSDCGHYSGYSESDFKELLSTLSQLEGKFLLSSYPSELLEKYSSKCGWYTKVITQKVAVANLSKQKSKTEVLTANYPI